eukprot:COSAG02_NODE_2734_length_8135_cov_185.067446_4_plen_288_part_00
MDPRPFVSGTAAGVIAGFVGHPLDTIRVRMQASQSGAAAAASAFDCARDLLKKEGWRAFFKGLGPQMIGYCAHSAIRFGVFGNAAASDGELGRNVSAFDRGIGAAISGAKAGIALSPIISVLELLKCRQQISRQVPQPPLRSVLSQLLHAEGLRGLCCGYSACLPRNICGNGSMFGIFELLKSYVDDRWAPTGLTRGVACICCSVVAGASSWLIVFPLDVVKTNIVTVVNPAKRLTTLQMAHKLWSDRGMRGLYRGLGPTMLRSIPVNAVYLPTYVLVSEHLKLNSG